ncbi:MAG: hypothetical protein FWE98_08605 [Oscillospiraceae bacterium]|nr:hypothetical protein [Oscillospiraceae bacterium]
MYCTENPARPRWNLLVILGFVLTWIPVVPFAGLALCIIGRKQCRATGARGRGLAAAGIALNFLIIAVGLLGLLALIFRTGI